MFTLKDLDVSSPHGLVLENLVDGNGFKVFSVESKIMPDGICDCVNFFGNGPRYSMAETESPPT